MEIKGTVIKVGKLEANKNNYKTRDVVVKTSGDYPQWYKIQFDEKKSFLLNDYKEGDDIVISVNVRGNKWTSPKTNEDMYFLNLIGWKVDREQTQVTATDHHKDREIESDNDDLPF
jgi:hypothetical protein